MRGLRAASGGLGRCGRGRQGHKYVLLSRSLRRPGTKADVTFADPLARSKLRGIDVERNLRMRQHFQTRRFLRFGLADPIIQGVVVGRDREEGSKSSG